MNKIIIKIPILFVVLVSFQHFSNAQGEIERMFSFYANFISGGAFLSELEAEKIKISKVYEIKGEELKRNAVLAGEQKREEFFRHQILFHAELQNNALKQKEELQNIYQSVQKFSDELQLAIREYNAQFSKGGTFEEIKESSAILQDTTRIALRGLLNLGGIELSGEKVTLEDAVNQLKESCSLDSSLMACMWIKNIDMLQENLKREKSLNELAVRSKLNELFIYNRNIQMKIGIQMRDVDDQLKIHQMIIDKANGLLLIKD